jgi:hypothetical protein
VLDGQPSREETHFSPLYPFDRVLLLYIFPCSVLFLDQVCNGFGSKFEKKRKRGYICSGFLILLLFFFPFLVSGVIQEGDRRGVSHNRK